MSGKKRCLSTFNRIKKDSADPSEYECEKCGKKFGNSLGDMELHKTIVHLQNGDIGPAA
jgi:transposase-like protein